ncbi:MAG: hypothetical protein SNJ54_02510 [Anaerolineae bacterium]|jgi:hypothetical protein
MMPDTRMEQLYAALTDAIANEASDEEINALIEAHQVPHDREVDRMVGLILRLHTTLLGVQPSPRFVRELRRDLLAVYEDGLVQRIRRLPARVQLAALLVMIGGFAMLFTRRRAEAAKVESATV